MNATAIERDEAIDAIAMQVELGRQDYVDQLTSCGEKTTGVSTSFKFETEFGKYSVSAKKLDVSKDELSQGKWTLKQTTDIGVTRSKKINATSAAMLFAGAAVDIVAKLRENE